MSTPAIVLEIASSRIVTSRDHPPSCMRLCASPNGYLNVCTPPASVGGGRKESGFCASSAGLPGPGALALRLSFVGYCFWALVALPWSPLCGLPPPHSLSISVRQPPAPPTPSPKIRAEKPHPS